MASATAKTEVLQTQNIQIDRMKRKAESDSNEIRATNEEAHDILDS